MLIYLLNFAKDVKDFASKGLDPTRVLACQRGGILLNSQTQNADFSYVLWFTLVTGKQTLYFPFRHVHVTTKVYATLMILSSPSLLIV